MMKALNQIVLLPIFVEISAGCSRRVSEVLERSGISVRAAALISGPGFSAKIAEHIAENLPSTIRVHHLRVQSASEREVVRIHNECTRSRAEILVSIGGGSVIDVGKRVHRLYNLPHVVIPTITSSDGIISPISVLEDMEGKRASFPAAMPSGVIADLDVIMSAPSRFLVAGAGDLLSNLPASHDWLCIARADGSEPFNDVAYQLAYGAADALLYFNKPDLKNIDFVQTIIRGQIYSGIAMALSGSSRPCSGAEHLISHAIDELQISNDTLHGVQVGSVSLFVLHLLEHKVAKAIDLCRDLAIPPAWTRLGDQVDANAEEVIRRSRSVRPGRKTVLDSYSDKEILKLYRSFIGGLGRYN